MSCNIGYNVQNVSMKMRLKIIRLKYLFISKLLFFVNTNADF